MRVARFVSSLIFSVILSFGVAFAGYSVSAVSVCAEEIQTSANAFDNTNVNDDLEGLDLSAITPSASLDPSLFYFMEYGFAEKVEKTSISRCTCTYTIRSVRISATLTGTTW